MQPDTGGIQSLTTSRAPASHHDPPVRRLRGHGLPLPPCLCSQFLHQEAPSLSGISLFRLMCRCLSEGFLALSSSRSKVPRPARHLLSHLPPARLVSRTAVHGFILPWTVGFPGQGARPALPCTQHPAVPGTLAHASQRRWNEKASKCLNSPTHQHPPLPRAPPRPATSLSHRWEPGPHRPVNCVGSQKCQSMDSGRDRPGCPPPSGLEPLTLGQNGSLGLRTSWHPAGWTVSPGRILSPDSV